MDLHCFISSARPCTPKCMAFVQEQDGPGCALIQLSKVVAYSAIQPTFTGVVHPQSAPPPEILKR